MSHCSAQPDHYGTGNITKDTEIKSSDYFEEKRNGKGWLAPQYTKHVGVQYNPEIPSEGIAHNIKVKFVGN